ncbi:RdgB/HAM1 family non-canonical purine NTP pyrophosphatase [Francisellaceae bacterium]|nr:RdgB/HAM1 family non-canonical purine NTP pyrophosphatase [Francisellaceae bacterium]
MPTEIVLASSNKGKIKEIKQILSNFKITPQSQFDIPDVDETGLTYIENAILKARHCAKYSKLPSLADDSGISVNCLNGQPGIYSARFAGKHKNNLDNINKLITLLKDKPSNTLQAQFHCHMALMRHELDPTPLTVSGIWEGEITLELKGKNGFGYDPVFYIPNLDKTAAEIEQNLKNKISHRAMALAKLKDQLTNEPAWLDALA